MFESARFTSRTQYYHSGVCILGIWCWRTTFHILLCSFHSTFLNWRKFHQHCKVFALSLSCTSTEHRPKTLRLFTNRQNAIGFDEAESVEPTQELELTETSYDAEGTAIINLRFVKFQRVNTLTVLFLSKVIPDNRFLSWIILAVRKLLVLRIWDCMEKQWM